jgi:hypothetical protein
MLRAMSLQYNYSGFKGRIDSPRIALRSHLTYVTSVALVSLLATIALGSRGTCIALVALVSRVALLTLRTSRADSTVSAIDAVDTIDSSYPRLTFVSGHTLRASVTSRALRTFVSSDSRIAFATLLTCRSDCAVRTITSG